MKMTLPQSHTVCGEVWVLQMQCIPLWLTFLQQDLNCVWISSTLAEAKTREFVDWLFRLKTKHKWTIAKFLTTTVCRWCYEREMPKLISMTAPQSRWELKEINKPSKNNQKPSCGHHHQGTRLLLPICVKRMMHHFLPSVYNWDQETKIHL